MLAGLKAGVAFLWRHRAFEHPRGKRRAHGAAGEADRAVDDDDVFRLRFQIIFLQRRCAVGFEARREAGTHLDAVRAHLYEINDVLA